MRLPTKEECEKLFEQYKVPAHIRKHCQCVSAVATFLAQKLKEQRQQIDIHVVEQLALLHDFMKAVVLERLDDPPYNYRPTAEEKAMHAALREKYQGLSETKVAYELLKEKFPEFARLFLALSTVTHDPAAEVPEEARLVHYADWRVMGEEIVPLARRMEYIRKKYSEWIKKKNIDWEAAVMQQQAFENKIFNVLNFEPAELQKQVRL